MELSPLGLAYAVGLSYLALHFMVYVAVLRERPFFQTERGIFFYHFVSALLFTAVASLLCATMSDVVAVPTVFGLAATHAIYSTSFLELWSLAQGGYSISIIAGIASGAILSREKLVAAFFQTGNTKKKNRIIALAKSSLIQQVGDCWQLTARGRLLTAMLILLLWLSNLKKTG